MISLILLIIFSLEVAYFATQNTGSVHILFGGFLINNIPLYIVVIGSLLLGIFISWLVSFVNTFSIFFTLHGKDAELKKSYEIIAKLQEQNRELEMDLAHLEGEKNIPITKENEEMTPQPSLLHKVKQNLGLLPR